MARPSIVLLSRVARVTTMLMTRCRLLSAGNTFYGSPPPPPLPHTTLSPTYLTRPNLRETTNRHRPSFAFPPPDPRAGISAPTSTGGCCCAAPARSASAAAASAAPPSLLRIPPLLLWQDKGMIIRRLPMIAIARPSAASYAAHSDSGGVGRASERLLFSRTKAAEHSTLPDGGCGARTGRRLKCSGAARFACRHH